MTTTKTTAYRFIAHYGPDWRLGVLTEHLQLVHAAGVHVRRSASGRRTYVVAEDGCCFPVVCSELVEVLTEDGRMSGRCGVPVEGEAWACEGHQIEMENWLAMSEAERARWEREVF